MTLPTHRDLPHKEPCELYWQSVDPLAKSMVTPETPAMIDVAATLQAALRRTERVRRNVKDDKPEELLRVEPNEVKAITLSPETLEHTLGYLLLSTIVSCLREQYAKKKVPVDQQTTEIAKLFYKEADAGMHETDPFKLIQFLRCADAFLQVDAQLGAHMFLRDGVREFLDKLTEKYPDDVILWRRKSVNLSLASGVPICRPHVKQHFQSWLQQQARNSGDIITRSSSAVALTKLSRAVGDAATPEQGLWVTGIPNTGATEEEARVKIAQDAELTALMKGLVISNSEEEDPAPTMDAIEGLAYLSAEPTLKESLSSDPVFLGHLFSLVPTTRKHNNLIARQIDDAPTAKTSTALTYGISVIISNFVCYPPRLTEEESQLDRLRRMARPGAASRDGRLQDQQLESEEVVAARGKRLIKAGVLPVLAAPSLVKAESGPTRVAVASAYLALAEPKENRGAILQSGGAKALAALSRAGSLPFLPNGEPFPLQAYNFRSPQDLIAMQALAKLAITTSPQLVFGTSDTDITDAIQPFHLLLLHPESSSLQRFEAIMALTNLSSVSSIAANRVATTEVANKLEILMLDDNILVRRAAVELVCNTITTEVMLPRYGDAPVAHDLRAVEASFTSAPAPAVISRVHVLLGLSDAADAKTQLAASGALATLLPLSPAACKALLSIQKGPHGVFAILGDIVDPSRLEEVSDDEEEEGASSPATSEQDPGEMLQLAHRGVVCIWTLLSNAQRLGMENVMLKAADDEGIAAALVKLIKPLMEGEALKTPGPRQIMRTAGQALKWLNDRGIDVQT